MRSNFEKSYSSMASRNSLCTILDLSKSEGSHISLNLRYRTPSSRQLLETLYSQPDDVRARVIIWSTPQYKDDHDPNFINAFGLRLKLGPRSLEALVSRRSYLHEDAQDMIDVRPLQPKHVVIANSMTAIARRYLSIEDSSIPIVLIAGFGYSPEERRQGGDIAYNDEIPPFQPPPAQDRLHRRLASLDMSGFYGWPRTLSVDAMLSAAF